MTTTGTASELQSHYYARTASIYDDLHVRTHDEHGLALAWLAGLIAHEGAESVLDVGSGTGRALRYLRTSLPDIRLHGVEPSAALRALGHAAGIAPQTLVEGDATHLAHADDSFDIVCAFGVLHHIAEPSRAVAEMLRVARVGIFISDDNHFAAGSPFGRWVKRMLASLGLWKTAYKLRTGGKGYRISEGDGLSYPYSVFDEAYRLRACCDQVQWANMSGAAPDLKRDATHVALFARKRAALGPGA